MPQDINPAGLLKRLRNVSRELPEVRRDCDAIFAQKQALVDAAKSTIVPSQAVVDEVLAALAVDEAPEDASRANLQTSLEQWNRSISKYFGDCASSCGVC